MCGQRPQRAAILLVGGFALFVVAIVFLVGSSLARRDVPSFLPTPAGRSVPALGEGAIDTLTVDASAEDAWRHVSLERGTVVSPDDTLSWDVALRRHHMIVGDAIADLGMVKFDSIRRAPLAGYIANRAGKDTANAAIDRWYSYSLWSHLLTPLGHVYVVRSRNGRYAKLEVLSYYCPALKAGCMTIRYGFIAAPER